MELQEARIILSEMNRWRRAQGEYDVAGALMPFSPVVFGEAIDKAIEVIDKELSDEAYNKATPKTPLEKQFHISK